MSKKIQARRSKIHGTGVFAKKNLVKGELVIEYKGLIRTHDDVDSDYEGLDETGHTFLFTLNEQFVIDANIDGNEARWINHSCVANCQAVHEENDVGDIKKDRILIEATRDIKAGEELTYNYGIRLAERHTTKLKKLWRCLCGNETCTGTLLQPKK